MTRGSIALAFAAVAAMPLLAAPEAQATAKEAAAPAPKAPFVNDIALPSQLWMLADVQNDIFVQPFLKRWRPYDDFVRFSITGNQREKFLRRLSHVASVVKPADGDWLTVELVNGDEFETVKRLQSVLRVGEPGKGDREVYAQILGDSFTHGRFFADALLKQPYVPKLHLVGLLKCGEKQYNEGRGGAALATYFRVPTKEVQFYHGYQQPAEGRYWGARAFWVMAWKCCRGTQPKGFEPSYSCSRYDDCVGRFDERTGVLKNPSKDDIQFDNVAGSFVKWTGSEWRKISADSLHWSFDYAKYLAMWNLEKPQFLFVMLGLNDWRGNLNADFTEWGERIEIVKNSYLGAVPGGRFVIAIPCSTCGSIDNAAGDFTPRQNAAMWRFRDWLIRTFDRREKDGYYLLDAGLGTDNDHGYGLVTSGPVIVPAFGYTGRETLKVQTGNPHPYPDYPGMGIPFAAFIQYWRNR